MFTTSEETEQQAVQEAGKGRVRAEVLAALLDRYYAASGLNAERLEKEILDHCENFVKQRVRAEPALRDDFDDLCQEAMICVSRALSKKRDRGERIQALPPWTWMIATRVIQDKKRTNTPRRRMTEAVDYIVKDSPRKDRFAYWFIAACLLIGLRSQRKKPFVETERYQAFCLDDTAFVQQGLQGRNPKDDEKVKLWELLEKFLAWIRTPLEKKPLVTHLLELRGVVPVKIASLADGREDLREPQVELYVEEARLDWAECWESICALKPLHRAVLLLSLECEELVCLTVQTDPRPLLASAMEVKFRGDASALGTFAHDEQGNCAPPKYHREKRLYYALTLQERYQI